MRANLIAARKTKGMTQVEVASLLSITERHYRALESGTTKGSVEVWECLKAILGASTIDDLIRAPAPAEDGTA